MKQKINDVNTIKQAEELMSKRAQKMQKVEDKKKKVLDKIKELKKEFNELEQNANSMPNYNAMIMLAKQIRADAFGANDKGLVVFRKDGKWFNVAVMDNGKLELAEIKKEAEDGTKR